MSLHPHLTGFLEGLCAASVTRYPQYGMFLRGPFTGTEVPPEPTLSQSEGRERLQQFFLCALSDTSAARPEEAEHVVKRLHELMAAYHPKASPIFKLPETRGWFDGLEVWMTEPSGVTYFFLDWSVS